MADFRCGIKDCQNNANIDNELDIIVKPSPQETLVAKLHLCDEHWSRLELPDACLEATHRLLIKTDHFDY